MFPANIQRKLMSLNSSSKESDHCLSSRCSSSNSSNSSSSSSSTVSSSGARSIDELLSRFGKTKPIADFYPNTTILMCDIAGFTAWSSARAPTDVFRLLETIYGAFDDIARASDVFKVETVGDCYVACAGLPKQQPKHATIIARFAKRCLRRYKTLIKKLEVHLGPDTVELGLRMGIHSGPVTAGVLRGDKTRFQLFGDTVNTASRMESTGQVNKIQVSEHTAELLEADGCGKWVVRREHLVAVKGKGEMQTYWLVQSSNASRSSSSSISSFDSMSIDTLSGDSTLSPPKRMKSWSRHHRVARNPKEYRLIEWIVEILMQSLRKIAINRKCRNNTDKRGMVTNQPLDDEGEDSLCLFDSDGLVIEEIQEIAAAAAFDGNNALTLVDIPSTVEDQLRNYVTAISLLYHDHEFHNFEHCAHVLMSVSKLLSRVLENDESKTNAANKNGCASHAYGITSDPLIEFSCLFSALIHDVDHTGVPNTQLVKENTATAHHYNNRSVAEQHSVALAWSILMEPLYEDLRKCIYQTKSEQKQFRQLVVNSVMATDIIDEDLKKLRQNRWRKVVSTKIHGENRMESTENANRMATVVIEHIIQASDVSHTMQHWHVFLKFNERLFREMHRGYKEGRSETDPSTYWYEGELRFFQFYIIPLAKRLKQCDVFGVSSDEYYLQAECNRNEWALKGKEIIKGYMDRVST
eukprot:jgi/Psemu1/251665/estExt_Genewise1Plus.C_330084